MHLNQIQRFLSYLPDNFMNLPPSKSSSDKIYRMDEELSKIVLKIEEKHILCEKLLKLVIDKDSFFEIGKNMGQV